MAVTLDDRWVDCFTQYNSTLLLAHGELLCSEPALKNPHSLARFVLIPRTRHESLNVYMYIQGLNLKHILPHYSQWIGLLALQEPE